MTNAAFKLEDSGFSREQVDALTEFMDGSVATKADIAELSGEIKAQGERLDGEIKAIRTELSGKINLLYWMLGVTVAGVVSLVIKAFTAS
ncbi:MAG TPA: hypothetical protein QGG18_08145 [Rhodospirillales bacterium]|nr:hypothetical protein [Rhodospirillales bacterium]